jgi:hypothetical protein
MPFITPKCRDRINAKGIKSCEEVGDICYIFYKYLVFAWKLEPRWRTVHRLYKDRILDRKTDEFYKMVANELYYSKSDPVELKFGLDDIDAALDLAWSVFFQNFVMPYENEKRDLNGDIQ